MIPANGPNRQAVRLLIVDADGSIRDTARARLASLFTPGDVVVANDAATLPASLFGTHVATSAPIEVRLAGWVAPGDPSRFIAVVFGAGDFRTRTEHRPLPPALAPGDRLAFGPLRAVVAERLGHPRLVLLHFQGDRDAILAGLARHGRPIQYAHVARP